MNGKSLTMIILIVFLLIWTILATNELFSYAQQKKAIEENIQEKVTEVLNKQKNVSSTR